jgi:hypothetical protein
MLANRDVESIKLDTKLGNCELLISAQLRNDDKAMKLLGENAMKYLIWHVLQASAFNKKSAYSNKSEYSDGLSKHLITEGKAVLGDAFSDITIATKKYSAPDKDAKMIKEYLSMGFDQAGAEAQLALVKANLAKSKETKQSTVEESD